MKHLLVAFALLLGFSAAATAQTTYTQTKPSTCFLSDGYNCNGIPLSNAGTGGSYYFHAQNYTYLTIGDRVAFSINGSGYYGTITGITQQPPPYRIGQYGPFAFTFTAPDTDGDGTSITGSVSGTVEIDKVGSRGWGIAIVDTSTVTIN